MNCRDFTGRVDELLAGETRGWRRLSLRLHATICRACAAYLVSYRQTVALVRDAYRSGEP